MIIFWCVLGAIAGVIAGLIPGLHSNNISALIAMGPFLGIEATAFMLSLGLTQAMTEFIPSTFIGAPSESTFESVLPAHKMLLSGRAYEAVCLTTLGAVIATVFGIIITPIFFEILIKNSNELMQITPIVLVFALIVFLNGENGIKKIFALIVIVSSSAHGLYFKGQIFPLITGYFGLAGALYSLKEKTNTPRQRFACEINSKAIYEAVIGIIGGAVVSIMPGIGSNTAAGLIKVFRNQKETKNYLSMLGAINSANFFFSFATLLALSKTRNGIMIAVEETIIPQKNWLILGSSILLASAGIGGLMTIFIARRATGFFTQSRIKKATMFAIIFMIGLVFLLNGLIGLIALFFSTTTGLLAISTKIRRSICMSSLIVPALFFYLFVLT